MASPIAHIASNQKFPYPYTLNVANFVSIKLSQTNFLLWKTQVLCLIESQDLQGFISGEIAASDKFIITGSKQEIKPLQWKKLDRLLRGWITGTLTEDVLGLVVGLETTQQVWKTLEEAYALDSQERECCLLQKLHTHKKKNMNISDYIQIFKSTCDELQAIGKSVNDHTKVFLLLNGLGSKYESFITSMLKPPISSYKEVVPLLQSHETMKQLKDKKKTLSINPFSTLKGLDSIAIIEEEENQHSLLTEGGFTRTTEDNKRNLGT
uniref:Retrotransposon Copia-like N-terminal domain-containing protein n=1 Tax=Nymphaea colorata TaxID=210225 RepID=A0A5K0WJW0_9MAGN